MIGIAIIAYSPAMRTGLRSILEDGQPVGFTGELLQVIYESASLIDIAEIVPKLSVIVQVDQIENLGALQELISTQDSQVSLLLLSDNPDAFDKLKRLNLQGWGILSLDASSEEIRSAVLSVANRLIITEPGIFKQASRSIHLLIATNQESLAEQLTERESQVLQQLARGLANKQIALELGISEHTVKFHVSSIYTKLNVTNRTEAVSAGLVYGLILL